jgi:hypothetical protein
VKIDTKRAIAYKFINYFFFSYMIEFVLYVLLLLAEIKYLMLYFLLLSGTWWVGDWLTTIMEAAVAVPPVQLSP